MSLYFVLLPWIWKCLWQMACPEHVVLSMARRSCATRCFHRCVCMCTGWHLFEDLFVTLNSMVLWGMWTCSTEDDKPFLFLVFTRVQSLTDKNYKPFKTWSFSETIYQWSDQTLKLILFSFCGVSKANPPVLQLSKGQLLSAYVDF